MEAEKDDGNVEYKLKLIGKTSDRIDSLTSQMKFRMEEGGGECIYKIGIRDDGTIEGITQDEYKETLSLIEHIAKINNYGISSIIEKDVDSLKKIYELLIREKNDNTYIDIKVAITGAVDAGKSSLLGLLTTGKLDDGRGSARSHVFNFKHEIKSGRTSSLAHHILGFNSTGNIVNYNKLGKLSWPDIVSNSSKIISFIDMAGHEKYLKTTISGLSSCIPDICLILVGANMGINNITKEHIFLCLTLKIPFVIIISKMDIVIDRQNVYQETMDSICNLLKLPGVRRIPYKVKEQDDIVLCAEKIYHNTFTPIFEISNVTGKGIDKLQLFFNLIGNREKFYDTTKPTEYHIDTVFKNIKGVGIVFGGNLMSGSIKIGDKLVVGPINQEYLPVIIKSIHCKRVPLSEVNHATYVCVGVKGIDKNIVRKGHVLLSPSHQLNAILEFEADINIFKGHSTTIKPLYEPIIHTHNIRQSAILVEIINKHEKPNDNILRIGDRALVKLRFKYHHVYMKVGYRLFLYDGKTKAIGIVTKLL
jgi:GTPase